MDNDYLAALEDKGPELVLVDMARGLHGSAPDSRTRQEVEAWLRSKQVSAEALASVRRDVREEETLSIARKAAEASDRANAISERAVAIAESANAIASEQLSAARRNARYAMYAAIVATIAAAIAAKDQVLALIFSSP